MWLATNWWTTYYFLLKRNGLGTCIIYGAFVLVSMYLAFSYVYFTTYGSNFWAYCKFVIIFTGYNVSFYKWYVGGWVGACRARCFFANVFMLYSGFDTESSTLGYSTKLWKNLDWAIVFLTLIEASISCSSACCSCFTFSIIFN